MNLSRECRTVLFTLKGSADRLDGFTYKSWSEVIEILVHFAFLKDENVCKKILTELKALGLVDCYWYEKDGDEMFKWWVLSKGLIELQNAGV